MEISRIHRKKSLRRYFSNPIFLSFLPSFPPKFLERSLSQVSPHTTLHSDSIRTISSFCSSSTGSSSYCSFGSDQKKPSLHNSSCGLPSQWHLGSNAFHKNISFCNYSSGLCSSFHFYDTSPQFWKSLAILKCYGRYFCLVSSSFGIRKPNNGGLNRSFSASSCDGAELSHKSRETGVILDQLKWKSDDVPLLDLSPEQKSKIIEIIRRGEDDVESKLSSVASKLSVESITEIFQVLNCQKISGLRFFRWFRSNNPRLLLNAEVCSLIINNCGWLDDYDTMLSLFKEFNKERICLSEQAFRFLPVFGSSQTSVMNSVGRLINLLNEVGGSCRGSGISALIEMFCNLDLFEMAKHVMEITGKKDSHYNILIRRKLKREHCEDLRCILREMREFGCEPTIKTYNYLLGSLCKNNKMTEAHHMLEEMKDKGVFPDATTFEICIHNACIHSNVDLAKSFFDAMVKSNIQPRLESHAAFIKALFKSKQYEEAHKYVIDSSVMYKHLSSRIYSLLADLHRSKGDLVSAKGIIIDMMDKGHKPDFQVYVRVLKKLQATCRGNLARDLKNRYSSFILESNTTAG